MWPVDIQWKSPVDRCSNVDHHHPVRFADAGDRAFSLPEGTLMSRRLPLPLIVALLAFPLASCAISRQANENTESLRTLERRNVAAVQAARRQLDSLVSTGRFAEAEHLAPRDLQVELPAGTLIRTRVGVMRWIAEAVPGARVELLTRQQSVVACHDGAVERGAYSMYAETQTLGRWLVGSGDYVARWSVGIDGTTRLRHVIAHSRDRRAERSMGCEVLRDLMFVERRTSIALMPFGIVVSGADQPLRAEAVRQGYTEPNSIPPSGAQSAITRGTREQLAGLPAAMALTARHRRGPVSVEGVAQFGTVHSIFAYNPEHDSGVGQAYRQNDLMLIMSGERSNFRLGAGPAFTSTTVIAQEAWMGSRWPGGLPAPAGRRSTSTGMGLVAQAGYQYPLSRSAFADVIFRYRTTAAVPLDTLWFYKPTEFKPAQTMVGLALGFAF
jgi:hypothetical protein